MKDKAVLAAEANIKKYLLSSSLAGMWFMSATWVFLYRTFATDFAISLTDLAGFTAGLLVEVPSGTIADKFGRKHTWVAGLLLMAFSILGLGLATSLTQLTIFVILGISAVNLVSGADEALMYDSLLAANMQDRWTEVLSKRHKYRFIINAGATAIGGLLFTIHIRLPHMAMVPFIVAAAAVAWSFDDSMAQPRSSQKYSKIIGEGLAHFKKPQMRPYIALIVAIPGVAYAAEWGVFRIVWLSHFGYQGATQPYFVAALSVIVAWCIGRTPWVVERIGTSKSLTAFLLLIVAGLIAMTMPLGYLGLIPVTIWSAAAYMGEVKINDMVQRTADSETRSTVLSVYAFIQKAPILIVSPLTGLASTNGYLWVSALSLGVASLVLGTWALKSLRTQLLAS